MPGDDIFPEIQEGFIAFHGEISFAIHHRDRARVFVLLGVEPGNQLVELLQVRVIRRLPKRVNHDRMNFGVMHVMKVFSVTG